MAEQEQGKPIQSYDSLRLASQLEQFETLVEQFAPIVATYYKALLDNSVPDELARKLVMDWHSTWWSNVQKGGSGGTG